MGLELSGSSYWRELSNESEMMAENLKIGELAKKTGTQVETIRFYEREGLLSKPERSEGNYRMYGEGHVERLLFIRYSRSLDMTLDEIRILLKFRDAPDQNCDEVNILLDAHIGHVAERRSELKALERQLKQLRHLCNEPHAAKDCGILNGLATDAATPRKRKSKTSHVHGSHSGGK